MYSRVRHLAHQAMQNPHVAQLAELAYGCERRMEGFGDDTTDALTAAGAGVLSTVGAAGATALVNDVVGAPKPTVVAAPSTSFFSGTMFGLPIPVVLGGAALGAYLLLGRKKSAA